MIRLLLVDDHHTARAQTIEQLEASEAIKIVGCAETSEQALQLAEKLLPDVILLDLHLPGLINSFDLIKRLTTLRNVKVIAFASDSKAAHVKDFLDAGAAGYLLKDDPATLLHMSIFMVHRGARNITSPALPRNITKLTALERTVLKEITKRSTMEQVAARVGISEESLAKTIAQLTEELELLDSEKLIKWARKQGF